MKNSTLKAITVIIALIVGLFILTGCSSKESSEKAKDKEYFDAKKNNDVETINRIRNERKNLRFLDIRF